MKQISARGRNHEAGHENQRLELYNGVYCLCCAAGAGGIWNAPVKKQGFGIMVFSLSLLTIYIFISSRQDVPCLVIINVTVTTISYKNYDLSWLRILHHNGQGYSQNKVWLFSPVQRCINHKRCILPVGRERFTSAWGIIEKIISF